MFKDSKLKRLSLYAATFATVAVLLTGCGGGGSDGAAGAAGAAGASGTNGTNAPAATTQVSTMTADQWANTTFKGEVTSVTIASPPVVTFKVTDAAGNGVVGLGSTSKSSTATVAGYTNLAFTLAKLVPGTPSLQPGAAGPSKWVSYIVTTVPTTTAAATATRPSTDNTGTLVDNGDGTYKYTFYRDVTKVKDVVAGLTLTGANVAADLGDLTYEPNLTHRLAIQISGVAPGTGTNTPTGVQTIAPVPLVTPVNVFYDFIPATGKPVTASDTQREIVKVSACFECHSKFQGFHNTSGVEGSPAARQDTRMCVLCHTEQRKFGRTEAVLSGTVLTETGGQSRLRDFSLTNLPNFIHKIHMGEELTLTGYVVAGIKLNEVTYPQPITNCVKCHSASTSTPQGDNWKNVPNRLACGSCHDGIDFATGTGTTVAGVATGHVGGAHADDTKCALCHTPAAINTYHVTVDPTGANGRAGYPLNTATDVPTVGFPSGQGPSIPLASQLNMPAGVYKIGLEVKQVTVGGAAGVKKATVIYRVMKDGLPVTLNKTGFLINGVDGTPDIYLAYGVPQDGMPADGSTVVDWTTTQSVHLTDIVATQAGPDANGYYTVVVNKIIPDNAKMVTGALGINYNGFVQLDHAAYPKGIRLREPKFALKTADGFTARRAVVSGDKCNSCHGQLGVGPSFHGGARNNGEGCVMCHTPNNSTGHTGAANSFGGGWSVSGKNLIHSIHASGKREQAFTYEATVTNPTGFQGVTYPGVLKNCEQCHVSGSYDFSGSVNSAALPNLLWTTEAKTDMSNPTSVPSIGLSPWITSLGNGQVSYVADNLVSSPVSSSCFGCHDSKLALAHIQGNGGILYQPVSKVSVSGTSDRSLGFSKVETCMVCHGPGRVADIKAVHAN